MSANMKRCGKCGETKPVADFSRSRSKPDGLNYHCKPCAKVVNAAWYVANRDARRVTQAAYRSANPERHQQLKKAWAAANPNAIRKSNLSKYGITPGQYDELVAEQSGLCCICGQPETRRCLGAFSALAVDHDHVTGKVRGLLCSKCNVGLGYFGDSAELLLAAVAYLRKHSTLVA